MAAHPVGLEDALLNETPTMRNGLIAGAAAAFAISFTPYYVLFGLATVAAFLAVGSAVRLNNGQLAGYVRAAAFAIGIPLFVAVCYALIGMTDESAPLREGTLAQVWFAKPALYFIPDPQQSPCGNLGA
jgi:cytochrome bd-type quinol oxidase subunit 2